MEHWQMQFLKMRS